MFTGGNLNEMFAVINNDYILYRFDDSGSIADKPLLKYWASPKYDLGVNGVKRLIRVSLYTSEEISLTVECDDKKLTYLIKGKGLQCVYPCLLGEEFKIAIKTSSNNPDVRSLGCVVEYIKGVK